MSVPLIEVCSVGSFDHRIVSQVIYYGKAILYEPRQANLVLIAYASSEGSGEPAHPRSLARISAARLCKQ